MSETMTSSVAYFILPNGDAQHSIYVGGAAGKATHRFTAESVLELLDECERLRVAVRGERAIADRERAKVRRLMAALADEVTR